MHKNNLIKKIYTILTLLLFAALSYMFIFQLLRTGAINSGDDSYYHVNRILEIRDSIRHGNLMPYLMTHSNGEIAYPLGIFYPEVTLIPVALVSLLFTKVVTGIYVGVAVYTFLTLVNMYWVLKKINIGRLSSILGSVIYTFSTYRTIDAFTRFSIGEFITLTFLPLVFYGSYSILIKKYKDWIYLPIGYIGIVLSHVLSAFIVLVTLIILFGINFIFTDERLIKFWYLIKAGIVGILGSLIFIIPFLEQELIQSYAKPDAKDIFLVSSSFLEIVNSSLNNSVLPVASGNAYNIGFFLLVIVILGLVFIRKLDYKYKYIYVIGIVSLLMASKLFPWFIFQNTPLSVIQYPFRLLMIPTICLSIIGAKLSDIIFSEYGKRGQINIIGVIFIILLLWSSSIKILSDDVHFRNETLSYTNNGSYFAGSQYVEQYTPKKAYENLEEIKNHIVVLNGKKIVASVNGKTNQQIFKITGVKPKEKVILPVSYYLNYSIWQGNEKLVSFKDKHNRIGAITKNSNEYLSVKYDYSKLDIMSYIVSIATWLSIMFYCLKRRNS